MVIEIAGRTNKEIISLHEELLLKNSDWTLSVLFYFKDDDVEKIVINDAGRLIAVIKKDLIHLAMLNENDNKTFCYVNNTSIENFNMIYESINLPIEKSLDNSKKIDQLLDKISELGIKSLDGNEMEFLVKIK